MASPPASPPDDHNTCTAVTRAGRRCRRRACASSDVCGVHSAAAVAARRARRPVAAECAVCLAPIASRKARARLACGHTFHARCVGAWFRHRTLTCPLCRATCPEGLALLGSSRVGVKLQALVRTLPPPPRAFFPAYIVAQLESPQVVAGLGDDKDLVDLLIDLACECFTKDNFFAKVRSLGL